MTLRILLRERTGLDLSVDSVERAVRERMGRLRLTDRLSYAPAPGSAEFEDLLDLLVVPESWMFRDPAVFEAALRFVQERLAAQPAGLVRILSLPCAGGEEAYTMAMLLAQSSIAPERCRVDAVDLSQASVARARQGRYTRNAFRGGDLAFQARWFARDGDEYVIDARLRDYVRFRQGNLFALDAEADGADGAAAMARSPYDAVFCRNLLIYFDEAAKLRAAAVLDRLLANDGLLLSGYAEAPFLYAHGFGTPVPGSPFALRKGGPAEAPRFASRASSAARLRLADLAPVRALTRVPKFGATHGPNRGPNRGPNLAPNLAPTFASKPAPDAADALLTQARRDADAGRLAEARERCQAALRLAPGRAETYYLLGLVNECAGHADAAERDWRRCLYLDPDHYDALCALALLCERDGDASRGAGLRERAARVFARRGAMEKA